MQREQSRAYRVEPPGAQPQQDERAISQRHARAHRRARHGQRRPFQQKCRADFGCRKTQRAQNANLPLALFDAQPEEQPRQQ